METEGYHISMGLAGQKGGSVDIEKLIWEAEMKMYKEKKSFYEKNDCCGKPHRMDPEYESEIKK